MNETGYHVYKKIVVKLKAFVVFFSKPQASSSGCKFKTKGFALRKCTHYIKYFYSTENEISKAP